MVRIAPYLSPEGKPNDRPTKYRVLHSSDAPGSEVYSGLLRGTLLHLWNGFAWIRWDGNDAPETYHQNLVWVALD